MQPANTKTLSCSPLVNFGTVQNLKLCGNNVESTLSVSTSVNIAKSTVSSNLNNKLLTSVSLVQNLKLRGDDKNIMKPVATETNQEKVKCEKQLLILSSASKKPQDLLLSHNTNSALVKSFPTSNIILGKHKLEPCSLTQQKLDLAPSLSKYRVVSNTAKLSNTKLDQKDKRKTVMEENILPKQCKINEEQNSKIEIDKTRDKVSIPSLSSYTEFQIPNYRLPHLEGNKSVELCNFLPTECEPFDFKQSQRNIEYFKVYVIILVV